MRSSALRAVGTVLVLTFLVSPATVAACLALCSVDTAEAHHTMASASAPHAGAHTPATVSPWPVHHDHTGPGAAVTDSGQAIARTTLSTTGCCCSGDGAVLARDSAARLDTPAGQHVRPPLVHTFLSAYPPAWHASSPARRAANAPATRPPVRVLLALRI